MAWWQNQRVWLVPTAISALSVISGVAINYATDLKHSSFAWVAVGVLVILLTSLTAVHEKKRHGSPRGGTRVESVPPTVSSTVDSELVLRRTEHTASDGTKTITVDIYNKEVAMQSLKDDLLDEEDE